MKMPWDYLFAFMKQAYIAIRLDRIAIWSGLKPQARAIVRIYQCGQWGEALQCEEVTIGKPPYGKGGIYTEPDKTTFCGMMVRLPPSPHRANCPRFLWEPSMPEPLQVMIMTDYHPVTRKALVYTIPQGGRIEISAM